MSGSLDQNQRHDRTCLMPGILVGGRIDQVESGVGTSSAGWFVMASASAEAPLSAMRFPLR